VAVAGAGDISGVNDIAVGQGESMDNPVSGGDCSGWVTGTVRLAVLLPTVIPGSGARG
jgi:hypothetical protein